METLIWAIGSTFKWRGAGGWEGRFAKMWLPNPRVGPDCKITQSPMALGCWSDDPDWSFHSLHEELGLHLICSPSFMFLVKCQFLYVCHCAFHFLVLLDSWFCLFFHLIVWARKGTLCEMLLCTQHCVGFNCKYCLLIIFVTCAFQADDLTQEETCS